MDWLDLAVVLALGYCVAFYALVEGALESLTYGDDFVTAVGLVATFGIGLLIGRWIALALALAPVVASVAAGDAFAAFQSLFLVVPLAAALGVGVLVRRLVERRFGDREPRWVRWSLLAAGGVMTAMGGLPFALAAYRRANPLDRIPAQAVTIDERLGRYRGVQIGDPYSRVIRLWGPPHREWGPRFKPTPAELNSEQFNYAGVAFLIDHERVETIDIRARNAQTRRGVGIGDNLAIAPRRYSRLQCGELNAGSDEYAPLPLCSGPVGRGLYMSFYEDPIASILLTNNPRELERP